MIDLEQQRKDYGWVWKETGPRIVVEGRKTFGVKEVPGTRDNPTILWWANQVGYGSVFRHDSIAWCGLWMAYTAAQAGWDHSPNGNALWAQNWLHWGTAINPAAAMFGDVLVFGRDGGGHVGLYIGEDGECYHVLGGNQSDMVCFKRIAKERLLGVRRCPWRVNQPTMVRKIWLKPVGAPSTNEA